MSAQLQEKQLLPLRKRTELFFHQQKAIKEIIKRKQVAVFLKPGAGKTAATLTALSDLNLGAPALIVAPIRVCQTVWAQEAAEWEHLQHLTFTLLRGSPKKRQGLLEKNPDFFLINYELLPWLISEMGGLPFSAIVWDELSMMKAPGSKRFRAVRHHIDEIPVRVGLTGTPTGNSLLNLFGEMYCVGERAPLGSSYVRFKQTYFTPVDRDHFIWKPQADAQQRILAKIKNWAFTIKNIKKPAEVIFNVINTVMPLRTNKIYSDFHTSLMAEVNGKNILALNDLALSGKVRQVCSGAIYTDIYHNYEELDSSKLDALADLIEELEGAPLLIFYEFQHELDRLKKAFNVVTLDEVTVDDWSAGNVPLLALHPKSGAHGLNLQHGGCDMVWLTVPWSFELWQQGIGRLARPGQKKAVTVHTIAAMDTVDQQVARALSRHGLTEEEVMTALELPA